MDTRRQTKSTTWPTACIDMNRYYLVHGLPAAAASLSVIELLVCLACTCMEVMYEMCMCHTMFKSSNFSFAVYAPKSHTYPF